MFRRGADVNRLAGWLVAVVLEREAVLLQELGDIGGGFEYKIGACGEEFGGCVSESPLQFGGWQFADFLQRESDGISGACDGDGEHTSTFSGLDADWCIINDKNSFRGPDIQEFGGAEVEPWSGAAGGDIVGAKGDVGLIALSGGDGADDLHEFACVAGGGADFESGLPQSLNGVDDSGDHVGAVGKNFLLQGEEVVVHGQHISCGDGLTVHLLPCVGNAGQGGDECDVFVFRASHGATCFGNCDVYAATAKDLLKHLSRCAAAMVNGGSGPVKNDGLNLGEWMHAEVPLVDNRVIQA